MAFAKEFERQLSSLFDQRTAWLRRKLFTKKPGTPPHFGRIKVNLGIQSLQQIASDAFAKKLARSEFDEHTVNCKSYRIRGYGRPDKRRRFEKWFAAHFAGAKGVIYTFWSKSNKCIYVGRTGSHGVRPSKHFDKFWFSSVKRVKVYQLRGKSHVPKLECLAIHHFLPTRNKSKASTKKWTKACPLCETHKHIEGELRDIFRFR
ncbi:hypothetical protein BH10PSE6_BH10PSE6_34390 [soil metagenome]